MSVGEMTLVVISTVVGKTLIDVKELNLVEHTILKDSDEIVNEGKKTTLTLHYIILHHSI